VPFVLITNRQVPGFLAPTTSQSQEYNSDSRRMRLLQKA
jgi:hypothetical protein